jgi:hypothetical protein
MHPAAVPDDRIGELRIGPVRENGEKVFVVLAGRA